MPQQNDTDKLETKVSDMQQNEMAVETADEEEAAADGAEENAQPQVTLPENPLYEVDVHMNTSVLYDYMLKHTYSSPMGLVATILGFMSILFFAKGAGVLYLVIGIIIIAYLPWNLFLIARKQAITNESFQKPLHYTFAEDGVYISQGDVVQMQAWENMFKAVSTPRSIIIYTSKVNASIFPRKDLGDGAATVIELICKHMPPKKVKIRQ